MHPNGQIPAYEWNFSDVNPPVHARACWRTYQQTGPPGQRDPACSLSRVLSEIAAQLHLAGEPQRRGGRHISLTGGFLGLDNIGVFDRSPKPLPTSGHLEQADGTGWMAYFCSSMLSIALELADGNPAYQDSASKFFEHFLRIARAMTGEYRGGLSLWDEEDGLFYDVTAPARRPSHTA